jgi:hypothetical protein
MPASSVFMDYKLTTTQRSNYLHAIIEGANTKENVIRYFEKIRSECKSRNCYKVLIEEHLEGPRIGMMDIYAMIERGSVESIGIFDAIAYVDVNAENITMEFAETVARNRGIPISVFSTVSDAEKWLLGEISRSAGQ